MRTRSAVSVTSVLACAALVLGACSSSDDDASPVSTTTAASTTTTQPRPAGPAADMTNELTGGNGVFIGEGSPPDLGAMGYVQREYEATGRASSYAAAGALPANGRWKFVTNGTAPYRTRVLVRAPEDPSKFSGDVMFEWLNVSGGVDANPEWTSAADEIVRSGDVWVGVSAQRIGVEGGPVLVKVEGIPGIEAAGKGLKKVDPARYGDLEHPGDAYAYDIFSQVGRAVRAGAGLAGLEPQRVIAGGESQSAFTLVSYYNGVQPLTQAFDGFLVHSRNKVGQPLAEPGANADIQNALSGEAVIFRTDQDAPVVDIQTENDVDSIFSSYEARQPDSDTFRLWEVAGTAHADAHLIGPANVQYIDCGVPINNGPMHIVAQAAWHALKAWLATGAEPARAPRLELTDDAKAQIVRDADGIALGGIRTPPVDVPVSVLSGQPGPDPSVICLLLGSSKPLAKARLAELYSSRDDYEQKFAAAADQAIAAGFVLQADREALLDFAEPDRIAG